MRLGEALRDVAEASPPLEVRADLFDRAWRVRRRRRFQVVLAIVVLTIAVLTVTGRPGGLTVQPGQPPDGLPSRVVTPPWQSADIDRASLAAALVVFARSAASESALGDHSWPLTLVGADDQYRVYERPEWTTATQPGRTFQLSPNGRALLMPYWLAGHDTRTRLLDLTSGSVRIIDAGLPLAWSPDGANVIVVHYDGDPTNGRVTGSIRVVDPLSGRIGWEFNLPDTVRFAEGLVAALSPDGSQLAVQQGTSLTVHRRSRGIAWQRTLTIERLAGPAAWTPDGRRLTIMGATGQLSQLDADAGERLPTAGWSTVRPQPSGEPGDEVIGWRGDTPVVQTNDRVVLLTDPAQVLVSAPDGTGELAVAADRLGQPSHDPGPPQGGPLLVRPGYLGLMVLAVAALVALTGARAAFLRRRRRVG